LSWAKALTAPEAPLEVCIPAFRVTNDWTRKNRQPALAQTPSPAAPPAEEMRRGPAPGGSAQSGGPWLVGAQWCESWGGVRCLDPECTCTSRGAATRKSAYQLTGALNSYSGGGSLRSVSWRVRPSPREDRGRPGRCAVPGWARRGAFGDEGYQSRRLPTAWAQELGSSIPQRVAGTGRGLASG
jgi:hypothetical protein